MLLLVLSGDQFAPPARQSGLDMLGHGDDLLGQFVGFQSELFDRFFVCGFVADQSFGQTQQLEQSDEFGQRQALGLLNVLKGDQLIYGRFGSFTQVGGVEFLARHAQGDVAVLHDGREVAVKRLRPEVISPETESALLHEARSTGRLEHPNIVPVHLLDFGDEGRPRLVMKRLEGVAWRELIRQPGHPAWAHLRGDPLTRHIQILMQVCNAVEYAHSRRVIHRDIKPANVMVGSFGEVYLVDWGIALDLSSHQRGTTPEVAGTPSYMAPEMLEGDLRADATAMPSGAARITRETAIKIE